MRSINYASSLVFDIETIPDVEGLRVLNQWDSSISDDEVLAQAQQERVEQGLTEFFPLYLQKIVVISCVFRDQKGLRVRSIGDPESSEADLVRGFFKTIDHHQPQIISWNGSGFDLPVLHYRALLHGVTSHRYWDQGEDDHDFKFNNYINRYHNRHIDLMDLLAKFNSRANAPLDSLARLCGFPGKLGMDGSQVWHAFQAGEIVEIRNYCETDVINTWLVYTRFRLIKGELDQISYQNEIDLVRNTLNELAKDKPEPWVEYLNHWPIL